MKTGYVILLIALLIITSGIAGYFIHQPKTITIVSDPIIKPDPKINKENDSLKVVVVIKETQNDSLKRLLSKYGIKPKPHDSIQIVTLPCDSTHILQQLQEDIRIWQAISTNQDSIIQPLKRHEVKLISEVVKRDSIIYIWQSKYNVDVADLRRQKKNILITGGSIISTLILSILFL